MIRTAGDLFCGGAGAWALGLHWAGVRTVWGVEIDPERANAYRDRWGVPVHRDVEQLTGDELGPAPWLLCGSPPCQDASEINQKGRGLDGDRTKLFLDAIRIGARLRPPWIALENVSGIRVRGADRILDAMAEAGYAGRAFVVDSLVAGKDHDRSRVVFIASDAARRERWSARQSRASLIGAPPRRLDVPGLPDLRGGVGRLGAGTLGGHLRAYDGVSPGVAERARAAYGDSMDPLIAYAVARALISWEDYRPQPG